MKTCKDCRYYMPDDGEPESIQPSLAAHWGECHAEPPKVISALSGTHWRCPSLRETTVACRWFEEREEDVKTETQQ